MSDEERAAMTFYEAVDRVLGEGVAPGEIAGG